MQRYKLIILLSSSKLVTVVFFKNLLSNSYKLVHECNLAIIGPRTVAFAQTVTDCYVRTVIKDTLML
jgi:hypothetical protein